MSVFLGMVYLLILEGTIYTFWYYFTKYDRLPREKVIQWLIGNKMWDIDQKLHYARIMSLEAMEREKFAAQNAAYRLEYRIRGLEYDRAEFMSFYHKQIKIRDNEIEFLKRLIEDLKKT